MWGAVGPQSPIRHVSLPKAPSVLPQMELCHRGKLPSCVKTTECSVQGRCEAGSSAEGVKRLPCQPLARADASQ